MATKKDDNSIATLLLSLGLSDKEINVYEVLLEIGEGTSATISQKADLKRGITYVILYNFEKLGLIRSIEKGKKTIFQLESPAKLLSLIDQKKETLRTVDQMAEQLIPKLTSTYRLTTGKPTIQYFEGEEGIKEVFDIVYAKKEEPVYGCVDLEVVDKVFPEHITKTLIPKRIRNKVMAKSFIADSPAAKTVAKGDKDQLRESVLLDKEMYPLPAEIDAFEDKVAMMTFKKGEFIGVLIDNEDSATTLKSLLKRLHELELKLQ